MISCDWNFSRFIVFMRLFRLFQMSDGMKLAAFRPIARNLKFKFCSQVFFFLWSSIHSAPVRKETVQFEHTSYCSKNSCCYARFSNHFDQSKRQASFKLYLPKSILENKMISVEKISISSKRNTEKFEKKYE